MLAVGESPGVHLSPILRPARTFGVMQGPSCTMAIDRATHPRTNLPRAVVRVDFDYMDETWLCANHILFEMPAIRLVD